MIGQTGIYTQKNQATKHFWSVTLGISFHHSNNATEQNCFSASVLDSLLCKTFMVRSQSTFAKALLKNTVLKRIAQNDTVL